MIVRNPATDEVISSEPVVFNRGEDAVIDESLARRLRATLPRPWVLIHGEDEIPEPVDPTDDNRVELVDERKPRRISPHQSLQEGYRGNFHALDLGGYE